MKNYFYLILCLFSSFLTFSQVTNPYLQTPTSNSIWVTWQTDSGTESRVDYGTTMALGTTVTGTSDDLQSGSGTWIWHKVQLTGLTPNTAYYYRVTTGSQVGPIKRFKTQPLEGTDTGHYRFVMLGDHQRTTDPSNNQRYRRLVEQARAKIISKYGGNPEDNVNLIVNLGDQVSHGPVLSQWKGLHFDQGSSLTGNIPSITVVGNHDDADGNYGGGEANLGGQIGNYSRLFMYNNTPSFHYKGITPTRGDNFYAFQVANAVFICTNSNQVWSDQTNYVQAVVNEVKNDANVEWLFLDTHHPIFAEQLPGDESPYMQNSILPILKQTDKFAMYMSGHAHLYARGALRNEPVYHTINGGASWDQYWGEFGVSAQKDYDDVQKTIIRQLYQIVDLDLDNREMTVETYSIGSTKGGFNEDVLIDTYYLKLDQTKPSKPSLTVPANVTLPHDFVGSTYSGAEPNNSTEFQFAGPDQNFDAPLHASKRDFENIYHDPSSPTNPSALPIPQNPEWNIVDLNAGVDIFRLTVNANQLYAGQNYVRVRYRDKSMHWSDWSDPVSFNTTNGTLTPPEQNPIAYFPFNGNINDESTAGKDFDGGTNNGATFTTDPDRGNIITMDDNDIITIQSGATAEDGLPARAMTAATWVKLDVAPAYGGFVGNIQDNGSDESGWLLGNIGNRFSIALASGGQLTYLQDNSDLTLDQWYHVAATYDGTTMRLYVDGVEKVTSTANSGNIEYPTSTNANNQFQIGAYKDDNEDFRLDGNLDEVTIWERALTPAEITALVNGGNNGAPVANFTASNTTIAPGGSVTFTDTSTNTPASWSWTFEGGTPASSTAQNPSVTYAAIGIYKVTLVATNANGSNTREVDNYITVASETVADYKLDGNANDSSPNAKHGTATNVTYPNDANRGQVGRFNNSAYIDIQTGNNVADDLPAQNITLATWVKLNTSDAWGGFVGAIQDNGSDESGFLLGTRNRRFSIAMSSTGNGQLTYLQDNADFNFNQWYHVAATYDGTTMRLYVDGVQKVTSTANSGNIEYPSSGWLTIGRYKDDNEEYGHDGDLDNVLIMGKALTQAEITALVNGSNPPVANFTVDDTTVTPGSSVTFTDTSTNTPTSWSWTFEGGTPASSTAQNPSVTYANAGDYKVTLVATNADGSNTKEVDNFITVGPAPVTDFSADNTTVGVGGSVNFTDTSTNTPTSWSWTFEGGTPASSSAQNPSVTYANTGTYKVTLVATNQFGNQTKEVDNFITVVAIPVANFTADDTTVTPGSSVTFTDTSTNTPTSWSWTFEGGTPTSSSAQNPSVTYANAGDYKVTLVATNADGSNTKEVDNFITVGPAPVTDFSADNTTVGVGGSVNFTDTSTNTPTSWSWTFEGGTPASSSAQNPSVTYATAGTYKVTLVATNQFGNQTKEVDNYITVNTPPVTNFTANNTTILAGGSVNFTDTSTNTPTSWSWTFEGGTPASSTQQNPSVTYANAGSYKVTLVATNADGSDTKEVDNFITVNPAVDPDTVVNYKLDGNANDSSPNAKHGTASNVTYPNDASRGQIGRFNNSAHIDIQTGNNIANDLPTQNMTVATWVKVNAADTWGGFISVAQDNGNDESGWVLGTRNRRFSIALASAGNGQLTYLQDNTNFTLGQWYHVAATYDGTTMKLYVDGVEKVTSTANSGNIEYPSTGWFTLGRYKDDNEDFGHDGDLDDVLIMGRAFTQAEITSLFNGGSSSSSSRSSSSLSKAAILSTNNESENGELKQLIYPNPAKDVITVKLNTVIKYVEFASIDGKITYNKAIQGNKQKVELDISGFASGLYLVKITSDKGDILVKKVIVE